MTANELKKILGELEGSSLSFPHGDDLAVYKVSSQVSDEDKMFAVVEYDKTPIRLGLRCDELLASSLREAYESVMASDRLNKKYWITVLLTGQVPDEEITGLITLSYNLAKSASL